ncbi:MAG TPA: FimV/HubP family polar landmark protein [Gammaproteobacteria bacterium]|nr:FimV/HubP family polar landmark protein [Gammaproteobacteria bacterium]
MRALARWGVMPLLAAPLGAWALGFGDIELQSALNQPFQAQIVLVATPDELQGLKVALASPEVFERYGIDRPSFVSRFEFKIAQSGGRSVVQVTSHEPVIEPFVTLLVEATWARGRRLREYTVLLDPPVLLPAPAAPTAVSPAQTRPGSASAPGGAINRPAPTATAPEPATPSPQPTPTPPRTEPAPAPRSNETPKASPPPRALPTSAPGGTYGPVRRAETLWAIADREKPEGVSINQMMVAVYRANPQAFGGNMNVLLAGATLRLPTNADFDDLSARVATAEVQRQTDEWVNRSPQEHTLRLLPPSETKPAAPAPAASADASSRAPGNAAATAPAATASPQNGAANASAEENRRLLEVRNEQLRNLQQQAAAEPPPADKPATQPADKPAPGVELESEPLFADEAKKDEAAKPAAEEAPAQAAAPSPAAPAPAPASGPSLISQALEWLMSPVLLIGLAVAAVAVMGLLFVRRRRQEPEDVTGRWEALQSEVADDVERENTERLRRQLPEGNIVVEEGDSTGRRAAEPDSESAPEPRRAAAQRAARPAAAAPAADETLSSQTVINLDQADPVAEADFHMAYGLYDQAAELVQKALDAAPNRRDLKLKLLEVFFVWGNKDAFLNAAQALRKEIGQKADPDWDKVVIMGKQICPDERLFAEATTGGGQVDVDLQAGDSPLDLAFDEASAAGGADAGVDLDLGEASLANFDLEPTAERPALKPAAAKPAASAKAPAKAPAKPSREDLDASFDIGENTAAGLEDAFKDLAADDAGETSPDVSDALAITQESPTIETPRDDGDDWSKLAIDGPTAEFAAPDAPTVETPTIESTRPGSRAIETPTVETKKFRSEPPTVEQPALASGGSELTAEIDLDDLGLDVKDLEALPHDLGDLPAAAGRETDTREQPGLVEEDELLSATGVTQVLRDDEGAADFDNRKTSVLNDDDATMLAPSVGDNTMTGTEVLEHRFEFDESGSTSLVKAIGKDDKNLDLNLDDLTAALHGADTVEQPRSFSKDVFGGGDTPVDIDIGVDVVGSDDPTGTEEVSPLDPQTMTEVGTKLDLARAYIDMGDPEGARSILEEVLDEGDPNQRREAQSLIDVLSA